MCPELTGRQAEHLARAIYTELCRQFDASGPTSPQVSGEAGMRSVIIEGEVDLVRLASTLAKRFCLRVPEIETVGDLQTAREMGLSSLLDQHTNS